MKKALDAAKCLNEVLNINPDDNIAWHKKGNILLNNGEHIKAIKCFEKAIQLNPEDHIALHNKGIALTKLGKLGKAIDHIKMAVKFNSTIPLMYYNLAWISLLEKSDKQEALRNLRKAIKLKPKYKESAKQDPKFKILFDDEVFREITGHNSSLN